ncbi:aspartyl-phosphate phosphatase Spo0E family protein [Clostridium sp. BNL1100]|uniref:aspartyl-phosphate phosphatase Spo0E family protein n=1 Tax=Clostridium sp. BNL1100 TaxID=755731 RepID=UPI00024A7E6C|nr:aspartyl-phosphate phosphatase Spo0E family protein [Clostridium sp. BNL1100]AEY67552.1 Spo0E like sporulation regulatory protein [Clostridium sp. BNL1100]
MSKLNALSQEIVIRQMELNKLIGNNQNRNTAKVLEKSQELDKLIVAYYEQKQREACSNNT